MKTLRSLVLIVVSIIAMTANATVDSGTCGSNLLWRLDDDNTLYISGVGEMENLATFPWKAYQSRIEKVVVQEGVKNIADYAFYQFRIEQVSLPFTLTEIGKWAFYRCTSLKEVTIPNLVKVIKERAFLSCWNLTTVNFSNTLTSIGEYAFQDCSELKNVVIPNSVTDIAEGAFSECLGLTSVTMSNSIETINPKTFFRCTRMESVTLSSSLKVIGKEAFLTCTALKSLEIPNSVTTICDAAFSDCRALEELTIGNSVSSIGAEAFSNCLKLPSVYIPKSVLDIGQFAFFGCVVMTTLTVDEQNPNYSSFSNVLYNKDKTKLISCVATKSGAFIIPNTVTTIENRAFALCNKLTSVTIPSSVTSLDEYSIAACEKLKEIYCYAEVPPTIDATTFAMLFYVENLNVPASSIDAYSAADYWKDFPNIQAARGIIATGPCGEGNDDLTYTLYEDGEFVVSGTGAMKIYTNGSTIAWEDYINQVKTIVVEEGVTSISDYAFAGFSAATSVSLPSTLTDIGISAFSGCNSITEVTIPNSVTEIKERTFKDCRNLVTVNLPNTITSIGENAFEGCKMLPTITLPNTVTEIGIGAFWDCTGLTTFTIPDLVPAIKVYTFYGCSKLESVTIPSSVKVIDNVAFSYCSALKSLVIPNSVTTIGESAFSYCSNLEELTIGNSVSSIGGQAFVFCQKLSSVNIPESVLSIGQVPFMGCFALSTLTVDEQNPNYSSLDNVLYNKDKTKLMWCVPMKSGDFTIPNTVTSIDSRAFVLCNDLTSVTIPSSVTNLGEFSIASCEKLTNIYCYAEVPPTACDNTFSLTFATLNVPSSSIDDYKAADCWKDFANIQAVRGIIASGSCGENGDNVTYTLYEDGELVVSGTGRMRSYGSMDLAAWYDYQNDIKKVVVEEGVTNISNNGFAGLFYLTSVTLPSTLTEMGTGAFTGCGSLTEITIPNSVTEIKDYTFNGCGSLVTVNVPENLTSVGPFAFATCRALPSITLPNTVREIATYAFNDCENLTSFVIPNSVETIGSYAFYGCKKLESVTIPSSVKNIEERSFQNCIGLKSLVIPNSVKTIGKSAFSDCLSITDLTIGNSVSSIGQYAFSSCLSLTSVNIPKSVESIGEEAFFGCGSMATLTVDEQNPNYCSLDNVLYNKDKTKLMCCAPMKSGDFIIPNTVTSIDSRALALCNDLTSVTIPSSVTNLGEFSIASCEKLTNIYCYAVVPPTVRDNTFSLTFATLNVPSSSIDDYKAALYWKDFANIQAARGVITSGSCGKGSDDLTYTLYEDGEFVVSGTGVMKSYVTLDKVEWNPYKDQIKSVVIEEGVTEVSYCAFSRCPNLTSASLPSTLEIIGEFAFEGCSSLSSVNIPESVTEIRWYAFDGTNISSIVIPNSVKKIQMGAFYNCRNLKSVTLSNSITSIDQNLFYNCRNLTSLVIPNSVTKIEEYAFQNCYELKSINIPDGVNSIEKKAFDNCFSLTSLDVPNSVTEIGELAFQYVPNVNYTGTATGASWGAKCINGYVDGYLVYTDATKTTLAACSRVATGEIEIPSSVTAIGDNAFYHCDKMQSVVIPSSVASIGEHAFMNCSDGLQDVYCYATTPPSTPSYNVFDVNKYTLHVPTASLNDYKNAPAWAKFVKILGLEIFVEDIALSASSKTLLPGETFILAAGVTPVNATDGSYTWASSDTSVAVIDKNGKVTAVGPGSADITCTANDGSGVKATCVVTVSPILATSISLDKTSATLEKGESMTLIATVLPADASSKEVTWKSSNENALTVTSDGKVTCVGGGSATITATTTDGSELSASCVFNCLDAIITVTADEADKAGAVYGTDGAKRNGMRQGVNIVVTKDGKRVKVVKK